MEIRKAVMADAEGMAKLYLQFWETHMGCDPLLELKRPPSLETETKAAEKDMRRKGTYIFVAEEGEEAIGFIEILIKRNDSLFAIPRYGYLNSCVVDKRHRGKGVAKALTEHALAFLKSKDISFVKTNVYSSNRDALKAWKRLGFKESSKNMILKVQT